MKPHIPPPLFAPQPELLASTLAERDPLDVARASLLVPAELDENRVARVREATSTDATPPSSPVITLSIFSGLIERTGPSPVARPWRSKTRRSAHAARVGQHHDHDAALCFSAS